MALSREATTASAAEARKARASAGKAISAGSRVASEATGSGQSSKNHPLHPAIFAAPRCVQCARELPGVPFALDNIVCRECYGLERYPDASGQANAKPNELIAEVEES